MSRTNPLLRRQARHTDPTQLERGRENWNVLEAQREHDQHQAIWRQEEMAKREKSLMGFARVDTREADEGFAAYGDLNQRLDEALGEVEQAMQRGRLASQTGGATEDDLRRSTALRQRKGVS